MDEEIDILFHIIYQEQESYFFLSKWDTVGDLKDAIFKKFGIAPYKQIIECWHKTPNTDENMLFSSCLPNECNFLVVYNIEDNVSNHYASVQNSNSQEKLTVPESNSANEPKVTVTETSSVLSFLQYFSSNFTNKGITFHITCLEDAFHQAFTSSETKKILLLFLHNKRDVFAKTFCEQFTNPEIQTILNNKVFLLCWDIENEDYKRVLIETLHKHHELKEFGRFIQSKTSAALFLTSRENSVVVTKILKGDVFPEDILYTLQNTEKFSTDLNSNEPEARDDADNQKHTFGSIEFLQLMLDMMGDRDYDSFDFYEFKNLKDKIGYALNGPPETEQGYNEDQQKKIDFIFDKIVKENNRVAKWKDRVIVSFIYVCTEPLPKEKEKRARKYPDYDPNSDLSPIPVFVLRKCKNSENPCRVIIDNIGRVYKSWEKYLSENRLPECVMIYPRNGRYEADENGNIVLERRLSPACDISTTVLLGADIASTVGGIASGGVMIAAASIPAVAAAPLVIPVAGAAGVAVGAYSLCRSAYALYDRSKHNENMSFFESSEARGAYISIVAGSLGFVGSGANAVVSKLAASGFNIGRGATATVNTLNIVNLGASGAGIVNASYTTIRSWVVENETPSLLTMVQLGSSVLFFGHAVYNYRSFNSIIEESQADVLKEYHDSLRSNKHRKMFTKLLKETIRQNDGNVQRGQAEVIATIKNIQNKDEVFATLARGNKEMNKNGVRFAASDGRITLNGANVDMAQFSNMPKSEVITFLTQLPSKPNPTSPNVRDMCTYIRDSFEGIPPTEILNLAVNLVQIFGNTDLTIRQKIMNSISALIKTLRQSSGGFMKELDRIFSNHEKYFRLVGMMNSFFQALINEEEEKYARWLETQDDEKPYFIKLLSLDRPNRILTIFNIVTKYYFDGSDGTQLTQFGLETILEYFYAWFARQEYTFAERQERRQRRREHSPVPAPKKVCSECGGHFYCPRE